jgi:hypothetical protein
LRYQFRQTPSVLRGFGAAVLYHPHYEVVRARESVDTAVGIRGFNHSLLECS